MNSNRKMHAKSLIIWKKVKIFIHFHINTIKIAQRETFRFRSC